MLRLLVVRLVVCWVNGWKFPGEDDQAMKEFAVDSVLVSFTVKRR